MIPDFLCRSSVYLIPRIIIRKTSIQATEFTENTEKEMVIFMFCCLTQKVNRNFVITVCFSSVISVFSVADYVIKDNPVYR